MTLFSLAAGVVPDVTRLKRQVEVAAAAGYRALGVRADQQWPSDEDRRTARALIDREGLRVLDVEVVRITPSDEHRERNQRLLDLAVELGAHAVLATCDDPERDRAAAALRQAAAHLLPHGVHLALEFMGFTACASLGDAVRLVEAARAPNLGVLVDALHLARTGGTPEDVAETAVPLPYAQLCDAGPRNPDADLASIRDEALSGRRLPGHGTLPIARLTRALPAGTPLSLEVRNQHLIREVTPVARARLVLDATRRALETP